MHMSPILVNTSGNNQIQIENTCHWLNTTTRNWCNLFQMMWHNQYNSVHPLPQEGQYCLWCRWSALSWPSPKTRSSTLITLLWFLSLLVMYTVVQFIVGCILYNEQIVWPWTSCFPFVNSPDSSIDFDWLQVHINKEQKLQYHRDKGQVCEMQGTVL